MIDEAPVAPARATERSHHGDTVRDDFEWLRAKDDPEVLAHLQAENQWCDQQTAHLGPLIEELQEDVRARTAETELSVPQLVHHDIHGERRTYWYYGRTVKGQQYPMLSRLGVSVGAPPDPWRGPEGEEVLLDGNVEAADSDFFAIGSTSVSPDGRLLAYGVDRTGDERFTLHIRDLATGMPIDSPIEDTASHLAWAGSRYLFYTRHDESRRPYRLLRHRLGTDPADDVVVLTEPDEKFWLSARESRDREWIIAAFGSPPSNETRLLEVSHPEDEFRVVTPRRPDVKYRVELAGDRLLITHNEHGPDFELAQAPLETTSASQWTPILPHSEGTRILRADAYRSHVVVSMRRDGLTALHILPRTAGGGFGPGSDVAFDEDVYHATASQGPNYDDDSIRLNYSSLLVPPTIYNYDIVTRRLTTLKMMQVLKHPQRGAYLTSDYVQRREWAVAPDGTRVPISLVAHRDTIRDGPAPTILYGYGAYERPLDPDFDGMRISLLDRGYVFAIAHVRGGGELGRPWYLGGKKLSKKNSFSDFVAAAQHLVDRGYSDPERIAAQGASAGGLLVGAAANSAPDTFRAVLADVPFVDPLTTGLDPDLPLTVTEWQEWGDPLHDPEAYAYIKSYSPYENVPDGRFPAVLATASFNDTRVSYTEAAKWVARLRATTTADVERPVLLKTEMEAGHGGVTGRYDQWYEAAFRLAWLMDQLDPDKAKTSSSHTSADDEDQEGAEAETD